MDCLFCECCQNFLDFEDTSKSDLIKVSCEYCKTVNEFTKKKVVLFTSEISYEKSGRVFQKSKDESKATIEETCPKCNYHEMTFFTLQLRSVDEGSTVFYECEQCGYKYNQDN
eukprot:gene2596-3557_t